MLYSLLWFAFLVLIHSVFPYASDEVPTLRTQWIQVDTSDITPIDTIDATLVLLHSLQNASFCPYETIHFRYTSLIPPRHLSIAVATHTPTTPLRVKTSTSYKAVAPVSDDGNVGYDGIIKYLLDEHSYPEITKTMLSDTSNTLTLEFAHETNQPVLEDDESMLSALSFYPPPQILSNLSKSSTSLINPTLVGNWTSAKELVISIKPEYTKQLFRHNHEGKKIVIMLKSYHKSNYNNFTGAIKLKPSSFGDVDIFLIDSVTLQRLSEPRHISISPYCDEHILSMPSSKLASPSFTEPMFRVIAPLSLFGRTVIQRPAAEMSAAERSWSISFWINLQEKANGKHRTLFYKGDIHGQKRTFSAWLLPHDNRITIRASTSADHDVGIFTNNEIPMKEWCFVAIVFEHFDISATYYDESQNVSSVLTDVERNIQLKDAEQDQFKYRLSVYMNDVLDVEAQYKSSLIFNDYPLRFFGDGTHDGAKAILQGLSIYDRAVGMDEILEEYSAGIPGITKTLDHVQRKDLQMILDAASMILELMSKSSLMSVLSSHDQNLDDENTCARLLEVARAELDTCRASSSARLDIYAEAAHLGSVEALYLWGMVLVFGIEKPSSNCGVPHDVAPTTEEDRDHGIELIFNDQVRGTFAILLAADAGHIDALVPLSTFVRSGIGLYSAAKLPDYCMLLREMPIDVAVFHSACRRRSNRGEVSSADEVNLLEFVLQSLRSKVISKDHLTYGLLHAASVLGSSEASQALGYRYKYGGPEGTMIDDEAAAYYYHDASRLASEVFHRVGSQPAVEADRINDHTQDTVEVANTGDDDVIIQHQIIRAQEGDVAAMVATGDLYYYGARGLPRDQPLALQYFQQAAEANDVTGLCGAANMLAKGEGTYNNVKNISGAMIYFQKAADQGSSAAMNGLGYIYFHGVPDAGIDANLSKAFDYFLVAAENYSDSADSFFNAGHMMQNGLGVDVNEEKAALFYQFAAEKFGHFDSILRLGIMNNQGVGLSRNVRLGAQYLSVASGIGPWVGWLRRGLDQYLASKNLMEKGDRRSRGLYGFLHDVYIRVIDWWANTKENLSKDASTDSGVPPKGTNQCEGEMIFQHHQHLQVLSRSLMCYLHASLFGYEIAQSNSAFLLLRKGSEMQAISFMDTNLSSDNMTSSYSVETQRIELIIQELKLSIRQGSINSQVLLGDIYFEVAKGRGWKLHSVPKEQQHIYWYTRASSRGHPLGSYYSAMTYQFGLGVPKNLYRASRYYQIALSQAATIDTSNGRAPSFFALFYALPGNSINDIYYTESKFFWSFVKFLNWLVVNDGEYKSTKKWLTRNFDEPDEKRSKKMASDQAVMTENQESVGFSSSLPPGSYDIIDKEWLSDILVYFHAPIKYIVHYVVLG